MMDDVKFRYGSEEDYEAAQPYEDGTFYAVGNFSQIQAESVNDTCHLYVGGKRVVGTDPLSPAFNAFVAEKKLSADAVCNSGMWTECVQFSGLDKTLSDGVYGVYADCRIDTSAHTMLFSGCTVSLMGVRMVDDKPVYDFFSTQCVTNPDGHSVSLFGMLRYRYGDSATGYDRISLSLYPSGADVIARSNGIAPGVTGVTKLGIFRLGNITNWL